MADYRPAVVGAEKTKKSDGNMNIALERTDDILAWLGAHRREGQVLCGFSMETQNMLENSRAKLVKKNVDMIVANSLRISRSRIRHGHQPRDRHHERRRRGAGADEQGPGGA